MTLKRTCGPAVAWPDNATAFFLVLFALLSAPLAWAEGVGQVTHLSGVLSVKRDDGSLRTLSVKSEVKEGDLLATQQDAYARVKFSDGGEIVMRPSSQVKVDVYAFNESKPAADNFAISLLKGGLRAITGLIGKRSRDNVAYKTPTATIGIRGTHFGILFCNDDCSDVPTISGAVPANGLHLDVAVGAVLVSNQGGQLVFSSGQFGYVADPFTPPVLVPPANGVQVTMPPNISDNKAGGRSVSGGGQTECTL